MSGLPRFTRRGWSLLAAGALLFGGGMLTGFTDLIRAGAFTGVLLSCAVVAVMGRTLNLTATRENADGYRLHCGEEVTIRLRISAQRTVRLPLELTETHTFLPAQKPRWSLSHLTQRPTCLEYSVYAPIRGEYRAGPSTAWLSDPLRLACRRLTFGPIERWLVWPRIVDLDGGSPHLLGDGDEDITANHAVASGYSGLTLREYAPGDDIRHVHWAATARQGELIVRQFDPPARPLTRIVVAGNVARAGIDSDWEALVSLAASTIAHLQQLDVPTELVLEREHFTARESALDALAAVGRCPSPSPPDHNAPTLLFHHASAQAELLAPSGTTSTALVVGKAVGSVIQDLTTLGWEVVHAHDPEDGRRCLAAMLQEFEARR